VSAAGARRRTAAVVEERAQNAFFVLAERPFEMNEMLEMGRDVGHRRGERAQLGAKLF
jgi:hypothetical protein